MSKKARLESRSVSEHYTDHSAEIRKDRSADDSYRRVLGPQAWRNLAPEIRARFSAKPMQGNSIRYAGVMRIVYLSMLGWLFAQFCRLIGTPLVPVKGRNIPMSIELRPDARRGGIAWIRRYRFPRNRDYIVRSTKCHANTGEFIEHIGCGFSMRLSLSERNGGLEFKSVAYEFELLSHTIRIPAWLTPGVTTVTHEQIEGDRFKFTFSVEHPQLGVTVYQEGEFCSAVKRA